MYANFHLKPEIETEKLPVVRGEQPDQLVVTVRDMLLEAQKRMADNNEIVRDQFSELFRQVSLITQVQETIRKEQNERNATLLQVSQRVESMTTQLNSVSLQQDALRAEIQNRWAELPNLYIPRKEHQAEALSGRVLVLEEFRLGVTKEMESLKGNLQQQVQQSVLLAVKDNSLTHLDSLTNIGTNRKELDARTITLLLVGVNVLFTLAFFIASHFWH